MPSTWDSESLASTSFSRLEVLASLYLQAKEYVIAAGYAPEIDWQYEVSFDNVTEGDFLREGAWVILASGIRESVVRRHFPLISGAFHNWESAKAITADSEECRARALSCFRHPGKINAILHLASTASELGYPKFRRALRQDPIEFLLQFPYLGPATARHLAKNIGLGSAKPDRHLLRVASVVGFCCPVEMCRQISELIAEPQPVVDIVIWRFATLQQSYRSFFAQAYTREPL